MKSKLIWSLGALGLSALLASGVYLSRNTEQPEVAAPQVLQRRSPQSLKFAREGDALMGAADVDGAIKLARAWQAQHPDDIAGFEIEARALAMNGDIKGALASGQKALALDKRARPRPWLDELVVIDERYPDLKLYPLRLQSTKPTAADRADDALAARAQALLSARQYDELEALNKKLLAGRRKFESGGGDLELFARALYSSDDEQAWKAKNQKLLRWHAERPRSALATLMLARSWGEGAYRARGGEYADKVKPEQWSGMNRRLRAAAPLFGQLLGEIKTSPLVFSGLQQWALLGQVPRPIYEQAWREAEAAFPGYTPFYLDKANYLMPRWYGEPGQWEAFAQNSADKIGGIEGDKLYARIVESQSENYGPDFLRNSPISWPRTKRGLRALIKSSADPVGAASLAQRLGAIAQDSEFERELFSGPLAHEFMQMDSDKNADFLALCRNRIHAFAT